MAGVAILLTGNARVPAVDLSFDVLTMDGSGHWKEQLTSRLMKTRVVINPSDLRRRVFSFIGKLTVNLLEREEAVRLLCTVRPCS